MRQSSSLYSAFNARWLTPTDVAKTFVPLPEFAQLVQTQNSLLMGPRGCGKTTLLKMLTLEAGQYWNEHRLKEEPALAEQAPAPDFVAVYIPSDIRWAYELKSTRESVISDASLATRVQRTMVSLASLSEALGVFEGLLGDDLKLNQSVAIALIDEWREKRVVPTLSHLRLRLRAHASAIRSTLNEGRIDSLKRAIELLPPILSAHAVDALSDTCAAFEATVPKRLRPARWALCFDELETAPSWLQRELLTALRNVEQRFLLKLTWTPVLPELFADARDRAPVEKQDFTAITLWQSHAGDAKRFCVDLTTRILRHRIGPDVNPTVMFGRSLFAADEAGAAATYQRGADIWDTMTGLASRDPSFASYLTRKGLDPKNPFTDDVKKRDESIRKVKPIALLRDAYLDEALQRRSRKRTSLYSGEEAIYSMSDGNPRWLAGVVNELVDEFQSATSPRGIPLVDTATQDQVLTAASNRMLTHIKHYPIGVDGNRRRLWSVFDLVERLGKLCQEELLGPRFTDEPVGSFEVDSKVSPRVLAEIERGLLLGAFIAVAGSGRDLVGFAKGARIRLSFMLAPKYNLLFRNYHWVSLSTAIGGDERQVLPLLERGTQP